MNNHLTLSFRRGDMLAILLVLALALTVFIIFLPRGEATQNAVVQIYRDGALLREYSLEEDVRMEISGDYTNILAISGGRAFIEESDCPGGDCMHSGAISEPGRSIVCLPNRVEIRISGAAEADVDFVVG